MLAIFKYQQFKNDMSDKTEPRVIKRKQVDVHDNKIRVRLDKYKNKGESNKYVLFFFVTLFFLPQKELTNMTKKTIVYISKFG